MLSLSPREGVVGTVGRDGTGGGGWTMWQGVGFLARLLRRLYTAAAAEYVTSRSENCAVPPHVGDVPSSHRGPVRLGCTHIVVVSPARDTARVYLYTL